MKIRHTGPQFIYSLLRYQNIVACNLNLFFLNQNFNNAGLIYKVSDINCEYIMKFVSLKFKSLNDIFAML